MNPKNYRKSNNMPQKPQKKATIDKNKLLAYILAGLMIFWTIASVFSFIAYGKSSKKQASANIITASAVTAGGPSEDDYDPVYLYELTPFTGMQFYDIDTTETDPRDRIIHDKSIDGHFQLGFSRGGGVFINYVKGDYNFIQYKMFNADGSLTSSEERRLRYDMFNGYINMAQSSATRTITPIQLEFSPYNTTFSWDYFYVHDISYIKATQSNSGYFDLLVIVNLEYYDRSGSRVGVQDFAFTLFGSLGAFDSQYATAGHYEVIYPSIKLNMDDGDEYGTYYYQDSYLTQRVLYRGYYYNLINEDYIKQIADSFEEGRLVGIEEGYARGKNDGIAEANDYSFISLIGAVVDVPIQAFTGLFDFDFLGINLASFFLSILTVAVIIAIVRMLM